MEPHPGARRAAAAAVWRGAFVVHGGFGIGGSVAPDAVAGDLWAWRDGWRLLADSGPPPARYPSLCVAADGLYRFGGCGYDGRTVTFLSTLWRWADGWHRVAVTGPAPAGRYTSAFAAYEGSLFVFGGNSQTPDRVNTYYGDLWQCTEGLWSRCHDETLGPGRRYGFGWVQDDAVLYVFGGFDGARDRDDFWRLDLATLAWARLPEGPSARYCPALGVVAGKVVLTGGRSKTDAKRNFDDTWMFDGGAWQRADGSSPGYHAKAAYASDGAALWLYGGEGPHGHVSDLWRFGSDGWTRLAAARDDDPRLW